MGYKASLEEKKKQTNKNIKITYMTMIFGLFGT